VADRRCHAELRGQTPLLIIGTANQLGANADTFLTAVAIGASCAFLTPIGHQNNTLILGGGAPPLSGTWLNFVPLIWLRISQPGC